MRMLSPRERQIAELVGRFGLQWDTIAQGLGVHASTIRVHVHRIQRKFDMKERKPREALVEIYWRYVAKEGVVSSGDCCETPSE